MRCPHCQAEPPRDPFVCAHCGEQVLTYLDEPLGPGTGLRADEVGVSAGGRREPVGAGVATADDERTVVAGTRVRASMSASVSQFARSRCSLVTARRYWSGLLHPRHLGHAQPSSIACRGSSLLDQGSSRPR